MEYTIKFDPLCWYENDPTTLVKLPNGEILVLNHLDSNTPYVVPTHIIEATEVSENELAFQSLLKEYNLTDNVKTRKLWYNGINVMKKVTLEACLRCVINGMI